MQWFVSEAHADLLLPDDDCSDALLLGLDECRLRSPSSPPSWSSVVAAGRSSLHSLQQLSLRSLSDTLRQLSKTAHPSGVRWPRYTLRDLGTVGMAAALIVLLLRSPGQSPALCTHQPSAQYAGAALPAYVNAERTWPTLPRAVAPSAGSTNGTAASSKYTVADVLIGVVTYAAQQNASVPAIMATWGRHFPHVHYYSNTSHYPDSAYRITPMPLLADGGPRDYGEMNTLHQLYLANPDSPWYYKADDDTWINPWRLLTLLNSLDHRGLYMIGAALHQHQWPHNYCHGGAGYAISNGLMRLMHRHFLEPLLVGVSDVQVGHIAARYNVSCMDYPGFLSHNIEHYLVDDTPQRMTNEDEIVRLSAAISFHHVQPHNQWLYELFGHRVLRQDVPSPPLSALNYNEERIWSKQPANFIRPHNPWPDTARFPAVDGLRRSSLAPSHFPWNGHCGFDAHVCVFAYSLHSDSADALAGAVKNAHLVREILAGWKARFYHAPDTPSWALTRLRELGAETVQWDLSALLPERLAQSAASLAVNAEQWAVMVALDGSVSRYAVRHVEQRLSQREIDALHEWMQSAYSVHVMRDHPSARAAPITSHMWAAVAGALDDPSVLALLSAPEGRAEEVLQVTIWPRVERDQLAHDSRPPALCPAFINSRPFPVPRADQSLAISQLFSESDEPLADSADDRELCGQTPDQTAVA